MLLRSFIYLYIRFLLRMPFEVPARNISSVWEKTVHAGLLRWGFKDQFLFSVFVCYRIEVLNRDAAKGLVFG